VGRVRRVVLGASALLGCTLAGILAAGVVAATGPTTGADTGPTTAATTTLPATTSVATTTTATTTPAPTTTSAPPLTTAPKPRASKTLPPDVRVGGVDVSGLTPMTAAAVVREAFGEPLVLLVGGRTLLVPPTALGARAKVLAAVDRARRAPIGTNVWLGVTVDRKRVDAYLARVAKRFDRSAVDSSLKLHNLKPLITKPHVGRALDRDYARRAIAQALEKNARKPLHLRLKDVKPTLTPANFGPVVVIRRSSNRLYLYNGAKLVKTLGVATGQSQYPTPLGHWEIVVKDANPWWYPPDSDWAEGKEPVPPGPGNPLGTRWMGLNSPAVGIHGTPDAASIGYSASHGCIRMRIPDAEWLFEHVDVGTQVYIVPA
jgi:lipoprotein-anchoring transpeptidase ErfK/SrfK